MKWNGSIKDRLAKIRRWNKIKLNEGWSSHAVIYASFAVAKRKPEKYSGLYGIRTLDLCETGAALYQLSQLRAGHWIGSFINPWMDDDEGLNIWKSCMWTAE